MASRRILHSQPGSRSLGRPPAGHRLRYRGAPYHPSDVDPLVGLASPGAFPCPEGSPSYNVQFSKKAGDGHLVAFGTEFGQLVIVDTRVEATVQRDHNGPVGWGQTDRTRTTTSGTPRTRRRLSRDTGGSVGYCQSWGVRQPEVVAQYRALVNCIFDIEWTHDDDRIALGCGDGQIRVHDTETHAELLVLCGHGGSVKTVGVNPVDNDILLSGSRDGSFALWDTRSRHGRGSPEMDGLHRLTLLERSLLTTAPANRVPTRYISPVEQVYRANCANYGALNQGRKRRRPRSFAGRDGENPEHAAAAAAGGAGAAATPPKPSLTSSAFVGLPCNSSVTAVCWMKDGQKFLTAGQDGLVKLWDTRYAVRPLQAACPSDASTPGRRSPRTSSGNAAACPYPPASSPLSASSLSSPSACGRAVPSSGDHKRGGERSGRGAGVGVGDRVSGGEVVAEEIYSGGGRPYGVSSVHACDDGSRIAVCTVKNHISVYSYASGSLRPRGTFTGNNNTSSYYIKAKLSPDGSLLASGATNDAVCLWKVDCPGPPAARLVGHVNEVTGLDFCRAEPLKLATCSDDETVRVWTIDPLRVVRNSAPTSSPAARAAGGAAAGGGRHASRNHENGRNATAIGTGGGGGRSGSAAAVRGVSGWTPIPVVPTVRALPGAGLGGDGDGGGDDGDGDDGRGRFVSRGKFGLGTARIGESSCWTRRPPGTSTPVGRGGGAWAGGRSGSGGGEGQRQVGGGESRNDSGIETVEKGDTVEGQHAMEMCASSPQPRTLPKSALPLPSRSGADGGPVVFCPRSPNKKAAAPRTPVSSSAALTEAGIGASVAISAAAAAAAARGTAPTRADENRAPDPGMALQGNDDGVLTGVIDAREQGGADMDLELGRLEVGAGVVVADGSAGASQKGTRGLLDGLPPGWSVAKGVQAGGRVLWQQKQPSEEKGGQEEGGEGRKAPQAQKKQKSKKSSQEGGRGATSRSSPLTTRGSPTLMEFWKKSQGGSSSGVLGKVPEGTERGARGDGAA